MTDQTDAAVTPGEGGRDDPAAVRARQQGIVAALGVRALSGLPLDVLLGEAADAAARALDVELVKVVELLPSGGVARVVAGVGWRPGVVGHATLAVGVDSQAGYALLTREPVVVDDLASERRLGDPPLLREHGVVSGMSVILYGPGGAAYGVLGAHTRRRRRFTADDVAFLQGVANVLSAAMQRRHDEDELRRAYAEAEAAAIRLQEQAAELEQQTDEAQALAAELEQANVELEQAALEAEEARDAADAARARTAAILDSLADVVSVYDREWRWAYLNPASRAVAAALGLDPDAIVGRVLWEELPQLRGTRFETETRRAVAEGRVLEYEEYLAALGRWFESRVVPGPDGVVTTFSRDVTERHEARESLRASEARYRALVEASTRLVWATDAAGMVDDMPFWRELTGQSRDEVRGNGWTAAIHPEDQGRVRAAWEAAVARRAVYEADYRLRMHAGGYRWFRARGAPVLGPDGALREWVGVLNDVDEERRAREGRALLERASEALASTITVADALAAVARIAVTAPEEGVEAFADGVAIDLPRPGGGFTRAAMASRDPALAELVRRLEREYPTPADAPGGYARVIRTGASELRESLDAFLPALARDARHLELLRAAGVYSSVVVPLRARGETLGAITLVLAGPARRRRYDARDLAVAEELARRAGIALDNAARYDAERAAADRARRLLAVSAGLSRASTPEQVAEVIFREGTAAVRADAGSLALLREAPAGEGEWWFEIVRTGGFSRELVERYRRFPVTPGKPLSDAVLAGAPRLLGSRADWRREYPEVLRENPDLEYEAFAAVPVLSGGRALAALSFSFREPIAFDEGTRTFLATLGEQCGLALERARAFEAEHRAREASAFLAEASRLLSASLEYETTLRAVAEAAVPRLGDWCAVDVVRDPTVPAWPPQVERLAVVHRDPDALALGAELTARYPTDWSSETGMAAVLREGRPLFIPAISDETLVAGARDAEHLALLRALRFSAIIVVPLRARGLTLGALSLCTTESGRRYDADDLALAEDLAQRAAFAVDNARLYREAEAARRAAQEANQAKSQFLANMSHELRTPLNAIAGHVELLEMGLRGPVTGDQQETLARVRRAQRHLLGLINDVLDFAKLEGGRVEFEVEALPLAEVVAEAATIVEAPLAAKGLAFELAPTPPAPDGGPLLVWADREKLRQVLLNLLSNAGKFTPSGGRVTVAVDEPPEQPELVLLRVRDTGIGIPPDKLEAIFEPFVQVESGRTRTAEGTGLGLSISRTLVAGLGGALTAESAPGAGSTFTVALRRVVSAAGEPVDRRTNDPRRIDEPRRSGEDRRDPPDA